MTIIPIEYNTANTIRVNVVMPGLYESLVTAMARSDDIETVKRVLVAVKAFGGHIDLEAFARDIVEAQLWLSTSAQV